MANGKVLGNCNIEFLLSILRPEYKTLAVGELGHNQGPDVDDDKEEDHTTSEGARIVPIAYERVDLVVEGWDCMVHES